MSKKGIVFIVAAMIFAGLFAFTPTTFAEDACSLAGEKDPLICGQTGGDEETELMNRVSNILSVVYLWIGIIAVVFIVIGGIKYMTSAGDSAKLEGAKKTITFSVVGLVVVLAAFAITSFVIGALDGKTAGTSPVATDTGGSGDTGAGAGAGADAEKSQVRGIVAVASTSLLPGQAGKIKVNVVPDYAKDKSLTFSSSDPSVVTVDESGNIKALKAGTATVTIAAPNGVKKDIIIKITEPVLVKSIKLSTKSLKITKGKTETVKASPIPSNATNKKLTWTSANPKIAMVDQQGKIKGVQAGDTTITVTAAAPTFLVKNTGIVLAAESNPIAGSTISAVIKVSVVSSYGSSSGGASTGKTSSGASETVGSQVNEKYSGRLDFRKETRKIVNDHKRDFFYHNYQKKIKKYGGYKKYVRNLGGVFAAHIDDKKIKIKTAADLQEAAEYMWGLWTIWGPDYGNSSTHHTWGGSKNTDGFYYGLPGRTSNKSYNNGSINSILKKSSNIRTNCNFAVNTFIASTSLHGIHGAANFNQNAKDSKVGKIKYVDKLQVGDLVHFFNGSGNWHHVAMVGEVYKDKIVMYEGGSRWQTSTKFKKAITRKHTKKLDGKYKNEHNWFGVRLWNIDQSKTLKGIN